MGRQRHVTPPEPTAVLVVDVFGTLIECDVDTVKAIRPVLMDALLEGVPAQIGWKTGPNWSEKSWSDIWQNYDALKFMDYCGEMATRELWRRFISSLLTSWGRSYEETFTPSREQLITRLHMTERDMYAKATLIADALEFLEIAHNTGLKLILCSNATPLGFDCIARLLGDKVLRELIGWDNLAVSCLVGHHKLGHKFPGGGISLFRYVMEQYRLGGGETIVIEDEQKYADVADILGMRAHVVGPHGDFPSLLDVLE